MLMRRAAAAAWVAFVVTAPAAMAADPLTLDDAFARVADFHPDLRLVDARARVLDAERERAALRPAWVAGATLEDALGTGDLAGLHGAELTLTLASVLERGGKLDARRVLAQSRIDALAIERETKRLDLLAEVARRYLAGVAAQRQRVIAEMDIAQRRGTVDAARRRVQAGASPESVVFSASAALARAELERDRAAQREASARRHLAASWGDRDAAFVLPPLDVTALPDIAEADALAQLLDDNPELLAFADERRVREARLQLARSAATPDIDWQVGVRRSQAVDDVSLVGSVSIPLGSPRRALPDLHAAEAELASLAIEREAKDVALQATLLDAHGRYLAAQLEVRRLRDDVLPLLAKAEAAAARAYRAGAVSYLEWAQVQSERTATRRQQLDAALEAQRALIEIQRLTGQAFVAGTVHAANPESSP